tara:strand:+ start:196 stop:966 length:771 start_codon:yes stop_codon:yes gene_type:complete
MKEKTVLIDGIKSNFKVSGEGKPLLILHGWGGSSDSWTAVDEHLSKKGFKIYRPDFPGFGKTEIPPKPWSVSDYVNWTQSFIKHIKLDSFDLLGHSFGCRVAVKLCVKQSKDIEKMILVGPAGVKTRMSIKDRAITVAAEVGNSILSWKGFRVIRNVARPVFYLFLRHKDYIKADGPMQASMRLVIQEDLRPFLTRIKVKTLLVWGEEDKMIPVKVSKIFKEEIKDSKLIILENNGHSPHLSIPERLSIIIAKYLQ